MTMFVLSVMCTYGYADTMNHYMDIVNNIPKMEIKADGQAQIWARSARNVLLLTCESVAESLVIANKTAAQNGQPLFCLPPNVHLDGSLLHNLIQQTYREITSQESDKSQMTVSQVALIGLSQHYPCPTTIKPRARTNIYIKSMKRVNT
ncbi:MAG TPA: phosphatase [Legionellaceae bacterium]|nr:phosphatase [Legionellaceae bacterium]